MTYIGLEGCEPKALPPQIVQFGSDTYYCDEAEGKVKIHICRLGSPDAQVSVEFKTVEGSALENLKFKPLSGSVVFDVGESVKAVTVDLVDNSCFDATLEFEVHLLNPNGCILGQYLHKTRVLIADDDAFPTNRYKLELRSRRISEIPDWALMVEYWKMNLQDGLIWNAAWKNMICDQFVNLHKVFVFWVQSYLVQKLMEDSSYKTQIRSVVIFCILHFVPTIITWYLDKRKVARRIQGKAINKLQSNLLRKFFYYDEAARNVVSVSDLTMAIARDVPELVQMGFASIFDFLEKVGLLFVLIILCCTQQRAIGAIWTVAVLVMAFPLLLVLFIGLRQAGTGKRHRALFRSQTSVVGFIQEATEGYRLIADYFQRPRMVGVFTTKIVAWNKAATNARLWECTNAHFAPIVTALFISLFVILNFNDVVKQPTVAPSFMVSIGAMKEIGQCYQTLYEDLLAMQHAIAPLQNIVFYMNLPVDVQERLCHQRALIEQSMVSRRQVALSKLCPREMVEKKLYAEDLIPISGEDVTFAYPRFSGGGVNVLENATFRIDQGNLIAVAGGRGTGKATLLGLLGGVLIPGQDCGTLFVPPHLRVLHVSYTPQMVPELNLWENLTFGPSDGDDENPERVLRICQRLGVSEDIVGLVGEELRQSTSMQVQEPCSTPVKITTIMEAAGHTASILVPSLGSFSNGTRTSWEKNRISMVIKATTMGGPKNDAMSLSYTDKSLIHLARGLVMNPEVLVIHKPLSHFGDVFSTRVLNLLREFVDKRGLEKPDDELLLRRPRTCIISVSALKGLEVADVVLRVSHTGIGCVDMSKVANHRAIVKSLFSELDSNKDGHVSTQEFLDGMRDKQSHGHLFGIPAACFSTADIDSVLMDVFTAMDTDNVEKLSFEQMLSFTKNLADYVLDESSGSVVSRKCSIDSRRASQRVSMESNKGSEARGAGAPQQPLVSTSVAKGRPLSDTQSRSHWFKKVEFDRQTGTGGHVHNTTPVTDLSHGGNIPSCELRSNAEGTSLGSCRFCTSLQGNEL